jgi:hypothetical protein
MKDVFKRSLVMLWLTTLVWPGPIRAEEPGPIRAEKLQPEEEAAQARRTIVAWLECQECVDGQLQAVVKLGAAAVPSLKASLMLGPSEASLQALRRHLSRDYKRLIDYAKRHNRPGIKWTEDKYQQIYVSNYIALYQIRSVNALVAIALAHEITVPDVKTALKEASAPDRPDLLRGEVKEAIAKALKELDGS